MAASRQTSIVDACRKSPGSDEKDWAHGAERPNAFVVSDVLLYREGLSFHLQKSALIDFVGAGAPTEETLKLIERLSPDAIIVDLGMCDSIAFAEQVRDRVCRSKTIAFA